MGTVTTWNYFELHYLNASIIGHIFVLFSSTITFSTFNGSYIEVRQISSNNIQSCSEVIGLKGKSSPISPYFRS